VRNSTPAPSISVRPVNLEMKVDCGLYQERELRGRNWEPFLIPPNSIDAVLLTHAHLDHCGLLPKLVREGFDGHVYCTGATSEIAKVVLMDSANIQQEDTEFKRKRHQREGRRGPYPEIPLYTTDDAKDCFRLLSLVHYGEPVQIGDGVAATFHDAGHILGSSMIRVAVSQVGEKRNLLFSGDVGRWNKPILQDPTLFDEADYVLVESTYGDRVHESQETISEELAKVINSTVEASGNILIPSFALERSQEVLYYLNELLIKDRIPHLMVFVDSPMAVRVTEVLCTGGRIKYHLVKNISRPESTILFVGYQAMGTLGREIVGGDKEVRILGQKYPVRAKVAQIHGFSAHADRDELLRWLSALQRPPRHLFVVHGESETAWQFADLLKERTGWEISVPNYRDEIILD